MSDVPATKRDVEEAVGLLRGEMREMGDELRGEMREMGDGLRGEMREQMRGQMRDVRILIAESASQVLHVVDGRLTELRSDMMTGFATLRREIAADTAHIVRSAMEMHTEKLTAIDDRYRDLPGKHDALQGAFDAHRDDPDAHKP